MMKNAGDGREIGEFREVTKPLVSFFILNFVDTVTQALQIYAKACPDETYQTIGKQMRDEDFKIHLIALVTKSHLLTSWASS